MLFITISTKYKLAEWRDIPLKIQSALACVLLSLIVMSSALGDEEYATSEIFGSKFSSQQTISGEGIMSSYRCIKIDPLVIKSHGGGSGFSDSDLFILGRNDVDFSSSREDYISSGREIEFNENISSAYFPVTIDFMGSFRTVPIRSTWSDRTLAGNIGGTAMEASFDEARSLVKEMSTKISGSQIIETIDNFEGDFAISMKLNSAFNGTVQLNMISKNSDRPVPTTMLDEYYKGAFSLANAMAISGKRTSTKTEGGDLPCCFAGYGDMNPMDRENKSTGCIFNCSFDLAKGAS